VDGAQKTIATAGSDWTRFGWDARRSNDDPDVTGITATNVGSLVRQQVRLPGTVDSSAIYLKGVTIGGVPHDTFFVTTTYGITLAIDAVRGQILWRWTPPGYSSWAGSAQITTATPVADPSRKWIYTASPDGRIQKLTVASGHAVWRRRITRLPSREKIAASLNFAIFLSLSPKVELVHVDGERRFRGIHRSRGMVVRLSALFGLDAFAGGLVVQSIVAYWFHIRWGLDPAALAVAVLLGERGLRLVPPRGRLARRPHRRSSTRWSSPTCRRMSCSCSSRSPRPRPQRWPCSSRG